MPSFVRIRVIRGPSSIRADSYLHSVRVLSCREDSPSAFVASCLRVSHRFLFSHEGTKPRRGSSAPVGTISLQALLHPLLPFVLSVLFEPPSFAPAPSRKASAVGKKSGQRGCPALPRR